MYGLSLVETALLVLATVAATGLGLFAVFYRRYRQTLDEEFEAAFEEGETLEFEPVEVTLSPLDYFRAMRHRQFEVRAAKRGYVKWYRLGSNWKRPIWVKPEADGAGEPKITHGGEPYYFDKDAMAVDAQTGAWVAVHLEGEADPLNLQDPPYAGIPADLVERVINQEAESKPPGFLDGLLGMDDTTLVYLLIGGLFVVFAAYRYLG